MWEDGTIIPILSPKDLTEKLNRVLKAFWARFSLRGDAIYPEEVWGDSEAI